MQTKIKLTKEQRQELLKIKKTHKSALIRDRAQAVLTRSEGFTLAETAKALQRSQSFVKEAIAKFKDNRLLATRHTSHNRKLSEPDRGNVVKILQTNTPKDFGHSTQFWTMEIIKKIIKQKYGVSYKTDKSYQDLFKAAGFSFHKPKTVDFRQDPEKIKKFKGALKKSYQSTRIRFSW